MLNYYLIKFYNKPSIVVEAPDQNSAIGPYIGKFSKCDEISVTHKRILVDMCGVDFVEWRS